MALRRALGVAGALGTIGPSACAPKTIPVEAQRPSGDPGPKQADKSGTSTEKPPIERPSVEKPMENKEPRIVKIEETTVATVDGWMVTVGNVMRGRWKLPDGSERDGVSAEVGLYDADKTPHGERTVGEGAALEIAGKRWTVVRVVAGQGAANGAVELRQGP